MATSNSAVFGILILFAIAHNISVHAAPSVFSDEEISRSLEPDINTFNDDIDIDALDVSSYARGMCLLVLIVYCSSSLYSITVQCS